MEKSLQMDKPTLGVCYYPEHWEKSLWENDLDRMLEHGIEIIRIAEFAWNKFEPYEGVFTFDFFDEFLELANKKGMKVIFCTPTATPPSWLTNRYPEVLNASKDGQLFRHGMRRHYNYNSEVYNQFVKRIVTIIAEHYAPNPAVIGWQIDNEFNCEINEYYSECDHKAFREYMQEKYITLDELNNKMGTAFWNQTYTSWDEVYLSRHMMHNSNNPHMLLEEKRFFSKSVINFCKMQADTIKKFATKEQFITTNGIFGHLDNHEMTDSTLDFITFDSYPNFGYGMDVNPNDTDYLKDRNWGRNLSVARSVSPNFGIMEQQAGAGGWVDRMKQPSPKPGQMRLWTFQSIAHGADFISYFRWRTCSMGTEMYWHGLNDYSNMPNRRLAELKAIHKDLQKLPAVAGTKYQAKIAFIKDYDNEWDGETDYWHGSLSKISADGWFKASQKTHTPMDFIFLNDNTELEKLKEYKMLVYPHSAILTKKRAELLKEYVNQGGMLVMGARTGYKDEFGRCPMQIMPGYASEICGVRVADFTQLAPSDEKEFALWGNDEIEAVEFNDILEPMENTNVLATFKGNYYSGSPALVENSIGFGKAYYFGAAFSEKTAMTFLHKLGIASPYEGIIKLPEDAELAVRVDEKSTYLFVLNYKPNDVIINVEMPMKEILSGKELSGEVVLQKYGVMVFKG